jgi:hypothetical protein
MDIRSLANSISNTVNGNLIVSVRRSTGSTIGAGAKQIPTYAAAVTGPAQVQALDSVELKQLDGMNIQGVVKGIYLRGALAGVVRPNQQGGDLIDIASPAPAPFVGTSLIVKVLEQWQDWCKCAIVLQGGQ